MPLRSFSTLILFIFCLALCNPGCKKDDNPTQSANIPPELVATWTAQAVLVNGTSASLSNVLGWQSGTVQATFTITAPGALTYTEFNSVNAPLQISTGTVSVTGSTATIKYLTDNGQPVNPPEEITATWGVTGNQLSLTYSVIGLGSITLSLTK